MELQAYHFDHGKVTREMMSQKEGFAPCICIFGKSRSFDLGPKDIVRWSSGKLGVKKWLDSRVSTEPKKRKMS